jgi:hypothetical protein
MEIGAGEAGLDQPDLDIVPGELLAKGCGEALDSRLGGDIYGATG